MKTKTLTVTLSALAFLVLSAGVAYAASEEGFQRFLDLSDEQKDVLEEARELRQAGDFEAAHELMEEVNIEGRGTGGRRSGFSQKMMGQREDVKEAIENADYDLFLELTEDSPRQIGISEDAFNNLVQAHALRVDGDFEGAREIMNDSGFEKGLGVNGYRNR